MSVLGFPAPVPDPVLVANIEAAFLDTNSRLVSRPVRRSRSGTLDWRSAMRAEARPDREDDRVFRGTERVPSGASALDIVVNVDVSWSTTFSLREMLLGVATLVEAAERVGHRIAVVLFCDSALVAKPFEVRGFPKSVGSFGLLSTNLRYALAADEDLFARAEGGTQVLINVGDGELDEDEEKFAHRWLGDFPGHSVALHYRDGHSSGEEVVARIRRPDDLTQAIVAFLASLEEEMGNG